MPGGRTQYYNVARNVAVGKLVFYRSKSRITRQYTKLFRCARLIGACTPTPPTVVHPPSCVCARSGSGRSEPSKIKPGSRQSPACSSVLRRARGARLSASGSWAPCTPTT